MRELHCLNFAWHAVGNTGFSFGESFISWLTLLKRYHSSAPQMDRRGHLPLQYSGTSNSDDGGGEGENED